MTERTRAELQSNINTDIADNSTGDIGASDVRLNMIDVTDSMVMPEDTASVVNVVTVADFPDPVSDVITLDSNVVYHLQGTVDLGVNSLAIPSTGASVAALNGARDIAILKSSEDNYDMFVDPSGGKAGRLFMNDVTITVDGANSRVFNVDNDGNGNSLEGMNINFIDCTDLGEITSYRQMLFQNIGFINCSEGFTLSGTWSGGVTVVTAIALNFGAAATLFKEGAALSIEGSIRSDMNFLSVDPTSVFTDIQPSNIVPDAGFTLDGFRSGATDAIPNFPSSDVKAKFGDCVGITNTYPGGEYTVSASAVTTIPAVDTLVKMAGTTTYSDLQWFSQTTDNAFVYDSSEPISIEVSGSLSFTNTNNKTMGLQVRQWDDSAAGYVDIGARFTQTFDANGSAENVAFFARTTIDENDRIEIWIENQTDDTDIAAVAGGFVGIAERAS